MAVLAVIWFVWQERNRRIFEDKQTKAAEIWDLAKYNSGLWVAAAKKSLGFSLDDWLRNWRNLV